jgi:hypothetical protein
LEAVFRSGIFRIFSGGFQQVPVFSCKIRPEIIEKIREIPDRNTASMFQVFPASFLEDPARTGGRNDRPGLMLMVFY